MERRLQIQIEELKRKITLMGGHVEQALGLVIDSLLKQDAARLDGVFKIEAKINQEQMDLDLLCMSILAKQAPVATDLRFIVSSLKMITDLERMGDQCKSISYNIKEYLGYPAVSAFTKIPEMTEKVKAMVTSSLDSFVRGDAKLAHEVILLDDDVDKLKDEGILVLCYFLENNPKQVRPVLNLITIIRNLERLADHSTNIAEEVIFTITGKDIRHGGVKNYGA